MILCVNEDTTLPSGCSIDSSSHVIKTIGSQLHIDFFGRAEVPFLEGNDIRIYPLSGLKKLFQEGVLNEQALTFNTLAPTLGEWKQKKQVKAADSWMNRFIPNVSVA